MALERKLLCRNEMTPSDVFNDDFGMSYAFNLNLMLCDYARAIRYFLFVFGFRSHMNISIISITCTYHPISLVY